MVVNVKGRTLLAQQVFWWLAQYVKKSVRLEAECAFKFATVIIIPCGLHKLLLIVRYRAAGFLKTFE